MIDANYLVGQRFGRLTVLSFSHTNKHRSRCYLCRCDCGAEKVVNRSDLRSGHVTSCGCYARERTSEACSGANNSHYSHGGCGTRLYRVWRGMINRCYLPTAINFPDYGAKGVRICEAWRNNFAAFQAWAHAAGYKNDLSIERKNSRGDYSPDNCEWITRSENTARGNRQRRKQ